MAGWPSVPGRLVKLRVGAWSPSRQTSHYVVRGEYRYQVGGTDFAGDRLSLDGTAFESTDFQIFQKKMAILAPTFAFERPPSHGGIDYVLDLPVAVHYDPKNPGRSIVNNVDARPLWWLYEAAGPVYWAFSFTMLALGLLSLSLPGLLVDAGLRAEPLPGRLRAAPNGDRAYGDRMPWLRLAHAGGLLFIGTGMTVMLHNFRPLPGEPLSLFDAVFLGCVGGLFILIGILGALVPRPEIVIHPDRSITRRFRHPLLPFLCFEGSSKDFGPFDGVQLSAGWELRLIAAGGKRGAIVCSESTAGVDDVHVPAAALALAQEFAGASGLRLEVDTPKVNASRDPVVNPRSATGKWSRTVLILLSSAVLGAIGGILYAMKHHSGFAEGLAAMGGGALVAVILVLFYVPLGGGSK